MKIMSRNNKIQLFLFLSAFLVVGGILSVNGKALDDDGDKTSLPNPIQGIAEATGIKMR